MEKSRVADPWDSEDSVTNINTIIFIDAPLIQEGEDIF